MVSAKPVTQGVQLVVRQPPTAQVARVAPPWLVTTACATVPSTWTTTASAKLATPLVLLAVDQVPTNAIPVLQPSLFQVVTPVFAVAAPTTTLEITTANHATTPVSVAPDQAAVNAAAVRTTAP